MALAQVVTISSLRITDTSCKQRAIQQKWKNKKAGRRVYMEICNRIIVNNSGSSGNNIIIKSNGKKLLVDLGISAREILKSVNYKIDDWSAAICSHR